jgi:sporulation protein YqfC
MSGQNKKRTEHLVDALELPRDVVLGLPLISLCGNRECNIDNHRGIISYEPEQIIIRTKLAPVRIRGTQLLVEYYTVSTIKMTGQIAEICFLE